MGKRGPRPQATKLRILAGNPGKRPLNQQEPQPAEIQPPPPPEWLDDEAKTFWRDLAPKLSAVGCLTELDLPKLEGMAYWWSRWRSAVADVAKLGAIVRTGQGGAIRNPNCIEREHCWQEFARLASQFPMSPADRTAIKVADAAPRNRLQDFVKSRGQKHG